jgi:hypothetical protein
MAASALYRPPPGLVFASGVIIAASPISTWFCVS